MEKELVEKLKQIDAEGLLFLLKQTQVLIHNAEVDKINREMVELDKSKPTSRTQKQTQLQTPAAESVEPMIEKSENGKSFFIRFESVRKIMTVDEMKRLVHICYSAESKSAALRQMYTVLKKERGDIIADAGISGPGSSVLDGLFHTIRSTFVLREE